MTSSAVFHLGGAGGAAPATSHFSWTIQHAPSAPSLDTPADLARSLSAPSEPWPSSITPVDGGSAWTSSGWYSAIPDAAGEAGPAVQQQPQQHRGPYRDLQRDPYRGRGPFRGRTQQQHQLAVNLGQRASSFDGGVGVEDALTAAPPTPVQWLSPPPQSDSWQHGGGRQWGTPGQGVVSLLPWFLGMSVVGAADSPAGASPNPRASPKATTYRPVSRPGARPGAGAGAAGNAIRPVQQAATALADRGGGPAPKSTSNGRLDVLYQWKRIDYEFPDEQTRARAIANGDYVPDNNLPLGVEAFGDRIFVSIPRWKPGVPATLAYLSKFPNGDTSAKLKPYPDWSWHRVPRAGQNDSCTAFTSVFRMTADECGRLWIIDSGAVDAIGDIRAVCPPQIVIFDLKTDQLLWRFVIPESQRRTASLFTNIVVDIRDGDCTNAYAYAADVFRYGLLVYSWREDRSYRLQHNLFYPDPLAARFVLDNVTFRWMDGIFGLALGPVDKQTNDRTLFFHPMASFMEFAVQASVIRNESYANANPDDFRILGARGRNQSHSSASTMDRRGVLFYNLVTQDALGCWDSSKPFGRGTLAHVAQDSAVLNFPNDLKVDHEEPQNIWLLSNRLHLYLYRNLSRDEYNFRILTGTVEKATEGTICDPFKPGPASSYPKDIDACEFT